eukprot:g9056.t1
MREMKLSLDHVMHPAASSMMSFGILGTGFQSVIYNTLISEMYKVYTGKAKQPVSIRELAKGDVESSLFWGASRVQPGLVWCFGRESVAMGLGLYLGPVVKTRLATAVQDETGKPRFLEKL